RQSMPPRVGTRFADSNTLVTVFRSANRVPMKSADPSFLPGPYVTMVSGCRSGFCTRTRRIRRTAGRILEQCHLGAAADHLVRAYSSGMRRRLSLLPRAQARIQHRVEQIHEQI